MEITTSPALPQNVPQDKAGAAAISYVRFSHGRQHLGDSLRRQLALSKAYVEANGLALQDLNYRDLGMSAFRGKNIERGALAGIITGVENGSIKPGTHLLVENFDRLSRAEVPVALQMFLRLVSAGIVIVTLMDQKVWDRETVRDTANLVLSIIFMGRAHDESLGRSKLKFPTQQAEFPF